MGAFDTVDEYIAAQPADGRERLEQLRARLLEVLPDAVQQIRYGMPSFETEPGRHLYLANWKQHIGVYPVYAGDAEFEAIVGPYRAATDTVKLLHRDPLPWPVIETILARAADGQ